MSKGCGSVYDRVVGAGVDVHYRFSTVALVDEAGRVVRRERLAHQDREALRERLARWPAGLPTVLEASFGWGWLSDLMQETGLEVRLSNCFKVEKMRQARGEVKTNAKDAALLAPLSREPGTWWEVWRAPQEVRNRREQVRHRADLVGTQTQIKCRIHAIFHRHGIYHDFSDLFGGQGRRFLQALVAGQDPQSRYLSAAAREALRSNLQLLGLLRRELAGIAAELHRQAAQSPEAQYLRSVPGFGPVLTAVVLAEIGQLSRFRSARALASYCLLAPRADDTGEALPGNRAPLGRHLGRRGNRTLKWALVEAAHGAVRTGGAWRKRFDQATDGGRRNRGEGYIKVARQLLDVVYAVLRDKRTYSEKPPVKTTRPGTGRPNRPMVAACR